MMKLKSILTVVGLATSSLLFAKTNSPQIDPPHWWAGMNETSLQLMVNGTDIRDAVPEINYEGVTIDSVVRLESKNYQLIYLNVAPEAKPGKFDIVFKSGKKKNKTAYELKARNKQEFTPFSSEDVLYLIMPDRFADGDVTNNNYKELNHPVTVNREDPNARHGGDLKGIENHLGYIDSLGVTAIWLTPVLKNDMEGGSYHGYATTDYYKVDPRFGSNEDYKNLIKKTHNRGMKVVMDMIFNHCGVSHNWIKDMPCRTWFNHPDGDVMTHFHLSVVNDPYVSDYDYDLGVNGWFVPAMPDLNQKNTHVMKYLIQNSIWWIEESQIDGIRMDTYPYADMMQMSAWLAAVEKEYPGYNVVGECWYGDAAGTAYWQKNSRLNPNQTNLKTVMDFPTMIMSRDAFHTQTLDYSQGLNKIYNRLSLDYLYEDVSHVLTFLENHDSDRFLPEMPKDLGSWKQAVAFMLTSRGIPQFYYGFELLMNGTKEGSDGYVRRDIPGGFPGDTHSEFTAEGRSKIQNDAWNFMSKVANWRRGNDVISKGAMKHFMPNNGLYVYQRSYNGKRAVVIMNGNDKELSIDMARYKEILPVGTTLKDVVTGESVTIAEKMEFPSRALLILE